MKHTIQGFIILLFLTSFHQDKGIVIDKEEAQKAFTLLNNIRTNPDSFYQSLHFDKNLKVVRTELKWNDTLAKVAEKKACDMAKRNYNGHVDPDGYGMNYYIKKSGYRLNPLWTKKKSENNFESIAVGMESGEQAIQVLIIDQGVPSFGHRNHLLGIGQWNADLVDIGIGFARRESGSKFQTYMSVIIAKHNW